MYYDNTSSISHFKTVSFLMETKILTLDMQGNMWKQIHNNIIIHRELKGNYRTNRFLSRLWLRLLSLSRLRFLSLFRSRDSSFPSDSPWECFFLLQRNDFHYGIKFLLTLYGFQLMRVREFKSIIWISPQKI